MLKKADHLSRMLGALVLAGGLCSTAVAQNPEFSLPSVSGSPGENITVSLSLSGAVANTSAINFTIRVDAGDAALLGGAIQGTLAPEVGSSFTYQENPDATVEAGIEYRGVLYPSSSSGSPPTFDASTTIPVVNLTIPIASDAAVGSEIDLVIINQFETSSESTLTGLVGISDSAGTSVTGAGEAITSGGPRAIDKVDGKITVISPGNVIDFTAGLPAGWEAFQAIPTFHQALPALDPTAQVQLGFEVVSAKGVDITLVDQGLFGSFGYIQSGAGATITENLTPGMVMKHSWTLASSATDPNANPNVRLRAAADGFVQISEYMEPAQSSVGQEQGVVVVPTVDRGEVDLVSYAYIPSSLNNGTRDEMLLALDLLSFFPNGQEGNVYTLSQITYEMLDPAGFAGAAVVYDHDFSGGDTDGFTFLANRGVPDPNNPIPGLGSSSTSANGLEVIPEGPPQVGIIGFAYGIWEKALSLTVESGKIYKIDYTVASSATTPVQTNISRLRLSAINAALPGLFDFVYSAVIESGGPATDTAGLPTNAGVTYTTFVSFPDELAGSAILLSFDGYQTIPGFPFENPTIVTEGSVTLKDVTITSYNRP